MKRGGRRRGADMKRATIAAISLLLIALAGYAHASDTSETAEICRNTEEWGELSENRKTALKEICEVMPVAEMIEKEDIHLRPGCREYPLTKKWLRRMARTAITRDLDNHMLRHHLWIHLALREQTCRLAHKIEGLINWLIDNGMRIEELKDELRGRETEDLKK